MLKRYFIVGDKLLCFIPRTGSTSLLTQIQEKYYPQLKNIDITPHFKIPSIIDDGKSELISMFRDPVERFISGCTQKEWTIEQGIEELKKVVPDFHIRAQNTFLSEKRSTKLFRFPDQLEDCAKYIDVKVPLPHLKKSVNKPIPTAKQLEWLNDYFKKDFEIFNTLK